MVAPLIPTSTMARLRQVDERAMPSSCRVLRRADTVTGGRVAAGDEVQVGSTVACRLSESRLRPREQGMIGRLGDETYGDLELPLGTEVLSGDRVEITTGASVQTFEITGDPWPASYSTSLLVAAQRED